ncbi:MAG: FHA domain-containing protein [Oscillospiraceae bacterium]|nr:FHA domain-containing protein [Oscillospiraceae bacterium]
MAIARCPKGHCYDDKRFKSCPYCGVSLSGNLMKSEDMKTVALVGNDEKTVPLGMLGDEKTVALGFDLNDDSDNVTVMFEEKKYGGAPVVGWLVCIEGPEKGRDYRLRPAKNFVGRSRTMDVSIFDDLEITRDNHMSIIYDSKHNKFFAVKENGSADINGKPLIGSEEISDGDILELGKTKLAFVPYCREGRTW